MQTDDLKWRCGRFVSVDKDAGAPRVKPRLTSGSARLRRLHRSAIFR